MDEPKNEEAQPAAAGSTTPEADLTRIGEMLVMGRASRAMTTAVELGVFDALAEGPATAERVARNIDAEPRTTEILLNALVSIGLLRWSGEAYRNTETAQRHLVNGAPESLASNFRYQERLAPAWAALPEIVRRGEPGRGLTDRLFDDPVFTQRYIRGMADISRAPARELAEKLELAHAELALDVGGGPGAYAAALAASAPRLEVELLDLEPTLRVADEWLSDSAVRQRIHFVAGDYHADSYGDERYDLVLMSHVTHDEGPAPVRAMIDKAYRALRPGGRLVIHDFMHQGDRSQPTFEALFSLHLMVYTQNGRTYLADEYREWMHQAGFKNAEQMPVTSSRPVTTYALVGAKP